MDQQIWQWTLTKEAIAPCFVRDVLAMRNHTNRDVDFFWLGHTPCRTVLLVGMVIGIRVYEKRTVYTIDDGTATVDCILRHPQRTVHSLAPRSPPRSKVVITAQQLSLKKLRLETAKLKPMEPPPPITEPGYSVRVVGRVVRHYQSKQVHANTIDPCPSSLDEIAHLEHVIELHKTKYSLSIPFYPPNKLNTSVIHAPEGAEANVAPNSSRLGPSTESYTLLPPPMPMRFQSRSQIPFVPSQLHSAYHDRPHLPSSPTASSIASSTPSSPCKPTSPVKSHEHQVQRKPKLRHPSRLHSRDLTGNTFRLYVKHYMDNAPSPLAISSTFFSRGTCTGVTTPTKCAQNEGSDEPTPRPRPGARGAGRSECEDADADEDRPTLGFTLSHLRRVPELALLAARVVRAETRKRYKASREKERVNFHSCAPSTISAPARSNRNKDGNGSIPTPQKGSVITTDPHHKKIKRLFSWAMVKLYEEGSIVLWDGDVRPLPLQPFHVLDRDAQRKEDTNTSGDPLVSSSPSCVSSAIADPFASTSASILYTSSASASLYSHYHPPRPGAKRRKSDYEQASASVEGDDADPGSISDPGMDEEAYVPLTPRLLAGYVEEILGTMCRRRRRGGASTDGRWTEPTAGDVLAYLQRADGRWARVGVWAVEEALLMLKGG